MIVCNPFDVVGLFAGVIVFANLVMTFVSVFVDLSLSNLRDDDLALLDLLS